MLLLFFSYTNSAKLRQYAKIEIIVGGKSNQEQVVNSDAFIKL